MSKISDRSNVWFDHAGNRYKYLCQVHLYHLFTTPKTVFLPKKTLQSTMGFVSSQFETITDACHCVCFLALLKKNAVQQQHENYFCNILIDSKIGQNLIIFCPRVRSSELLLYIRMSQLPQNHASRLGIGMKLHPRTTDNPLSKSLSLEEPMITSATHNITSQCGSKKHDRDSYVMDILVI